MIKAAQKLKLGKLSGAYGTELKFRQAPRESVHKYFTYRYYPQSTGNHKYGPVVSEDEDVVHLNKQIIFTFIVPIAKTTKSAVLRRRLRHRLLDAFRVSLKEAGPDVLPREPMHMIMTPNMTVLLAPFQNLKADASETYALANRQSGKNPASQASEATDSKATALATEMRPLRSKRPELRGDKYDLRAQQQRTINKIPKTRYLASHGGARALLEKMQQTSSSDNQK